MMEIGTCGFPLGNVLQEQIGTVTSSFTKGTISSIILAANVARDHLQGFQLDLTATNGNSGGAVFSLATGKVLGVLQGGIQAVFRCRALPRLNQFIRSSITTWFTAWCRVWSHPTPLRDMWLLALAIPLAPVFKAKAGRPAPSPRLPVSR